MIQSKPADRALAADALTVAAIVMISAVPYLFDLGFYSDDWTIISRFDAAARQGGYHLGPVLELFDARPIQGLYAGMLFALFGFDPLPYHLVNTVVLATGVCLLYLLLVRLQFSRTEALATALLFATLPHLSTVRVWYAAFQVPLSFALALASTHWQLSFVRSGKGLWLALAALCAILSISAYEIFAPLIALFAVGLAILSWQRRTQSRRSWRTGAIGAVVILSAVAFSFLYKVAVSERTGSLSSPYHYAWILFEMFRPDYDWRVDGGLNVFAATLVHFWFTVRGWGDGLEALLTGESGLVATIAAAAIAALTLWRLLASVNSSERPNTGKLLMAGIIVFVAGHGAFLIVPMIAFAPTGIGNRVLVAAAIGVAMIFVSIIAFQARLMPLSLRKTVFALGVVAVTAASFARLVMIERYWAEVPAEHRQLLSAAKADLQGLPEGSTIILDGICPYHGPAVVFESWWDVGDALSLALGRKIGGDIFTTRLRFTQTGIATTFYDETRFYDYGRSLYIYNPNRNQIVPLADLAAAKSFLRQRQSPSCPPGYLGHGVRI